MYKEVPVDLSKIKKFNDRINLVGVELEGFWDKNIPPGTKIIRDGSVVENSETIIRLGILQVGELPSPPLDTKEWKTWVKKYYPVYVNYTCGMHIHMSMKNALAYQRLITPLYPATIVKSVTDWAKDNGLKSSHPIWPRLRGESEFCQHTFSADLQLENKSKDYDHHRPGNRYSVIVYHYNRLGTVECRLLPMMKDAELAISALQNILDTTNKFLVATAKKEEKVVSEYREKEDGYVEHRRFRV